jgi:cytochrome o ubiquinol oxidase operon protein cyoD
VDESQTCCGIGVIQRAVRGLSEPCGLHAGAIRGLPSRRACRPEGGTAHLDQHRVGLHCGDARDRAPVLLVRCYQDKPENDAPYRPEWSESKTLEVVWWGIPILIIGFVLSIILTLAALWLVLGHVMRPGPLFFTIMVLAVLQIGVQLFFFMHITESYGPAWHVWMLTLGMVLVVTIVAGSIWIMTFGGDVAY